MVLRPEERTTEEQSRADGKPVVMFREMPEGMTPAVHYFYYPTDLRGKEFIYPKDQALKIAAATHETVLATDTDVEKGGEAHVFSVEPNGARRSPARPNATALECQHERALRRRPSRQARVDCQPEQPERSEQLARVGSAVARGSNRPEHPITRRPGTSGSASQPENTAPRQQASSELPKTASPYPAHRVARSALACRRLRPAAGT